MHNNNKTSKLLIGLCFVISFIYGTLLLMIGYTQGGLANLIFGSGNKGNMVFLLLGQSVGLIIATLIANKLIKMFDIRWIFLSGFCLASIVLILISLLDKIAPRESTLATNAINVQALTFFIVLSLILGVSIGSVSPLVSTYFGAVLQGKQLDTYLSVSNGVYGIGAGIIPLVAARPIYDLNQTAESEGLGPVRYFYYIACFLAVLGAICGFFLSFKHSKQLTSSKILASQTSELEKSSSMVLKPNSKKINFSVWGPLIIALAIMSCYMISETISNYMFVNVATARGHDSLDQKVYATMAFGLFVMVQGVWRTICGLFIMKKVTKPQFIIGSIIVFIIAFIMVLAGTLDKTWGQFIVAILIGLGLGNLWPAIYSYTIEIDSNRASYIGMRVNIISMFWIPTTQAIIAPIWSQINNNSGFAFYTPIMIGFITAMGVLALTLYFVVYITKFRAKHQIENK